MSLTFLTLNPYRDDCDLHSGWLAQIRGLKREGRVQFCTIAMMSSTNLSIPVSLWGSRNPVNTHDTCHHTGFAADKVGCLRLDDCVHLPESLL
jgi:hypothetical protein